MAFAPGFQTLAGQRVRNGIDYNQEIKIREPFYTTGDFQKDKIDIARYYQSIPGVQKSWIKNYLADAAE